MEAWRDLAEGQLGLIGRRQLLRSGISRHRIDDLVRRGQLLRYRHTVLKLSGASVTWRTQVMAACLPMTAFNRDAERLSELTARGYRPIEVTLEQIRDRPFALAQRLRQLGIE